MGLRGAGRDSRGLDRRLEAARNLDLATKVMGDQPVGWTGSNSISAAPTKWIRVVQGAGPGRGHRDLAADPERIPMPGAQRTPVTDPRDEAVLLEPSLRDRDRHTASGT
jgi:hypothetical protein